jgi:hypothetical protein
MAGPNGVRAIAVREASVKTAAVEVKALTISGKQVTLAVFRQLMSETVVDMDTLQYQGVPWGRVHYFWGDCANRGYAGHLHVVWQKGTELRRDCVERTDVVEQVDELRRRANLLTGLIVLWRALGGDAVTSSKGGEYPEWLACGDERFRWNTRKYARHSIVGAIRDLQGSEMESLRRWGREQVLGLVNEILEQLPINPAYIGAASGTANLDAVRASRAATFSEALRIENTWAKRYAELQALDQLFIAV